MQGLLIIIIMRAILREYIYIDGIRHRTRKAQSHRHEPRNAYDVKIILDDCELKHAIVTVFDEIDRSDEHKPLDIITIDHIRNYYHFSHSPHRSIAYTLSHSPMSAQEVGAIILDKPKSLCITLRNSNKKQRINNV